MPLLRQLSYSEIDAAHALYLRVFHWLRDNRVRQWLDALPRDEFLARQDRHELFGYFNDHDLMAVVTLTHESPHYWCLPIEASSRLWMKSLAVNRSLAGNGVGTAVIHACETLAVRRGFDSLWLDCVDSGFLPEYYRRRAYVELASKAIATPSGDMLTMALMRKNLRNEMLTVRSSLNDNDLQV